MRVINITHKDLDGAASSIFVMKEHEEVTTIFATYDSIDKLVLCTLGSLEKDTTLFITDISPSENTCKEIDKKIKDGYVIKVIDHHVTKKSILSKYSWAIFDTEACGAQLTYSHLGLEDETLGAFASAVDAWDRWKLKSTNRKRGENLNTLCQFLGVEKFILVFGEDINADMNLFYSPLLVMLEEKKKREIGSTIESQLYTSKNYMDDFGNTFKIIYTSEHISELGNSILRHPGGQDLQYVVMADLNRDKLHFRSREEEAYNVDVGALAKRLGGGGHKAASGCSLKNRHKSEKHIFTLLNMVDSK